MKLHDSLGFKVRGHVRIVDDLGNVLVNKGNAVHPQNMARIFARALANESNRSVYRIAFGNGGTTTDAAYTVSFNPANDGQPPDTRTWDSRLYNETYSEIIDEGSSILNTLLGTDPGTADPNVGTRPGGGSVPLSDPTSTLHTSGPGVRSVEEGISSQVIITCVLNPDEPTGQTDGSPDPLFAGTFSFDELGLYTEGAAAAPSAGIAEVDVGNKTTQDDTGLAINTPYQFHIRVDVPAGENPAYQTISFTTPSGGSGPLNEILYGDLCEAINSGDTSWNVLWDNANPLPGNATVAITDDTIDYPSITGAQTFGRLRFVSQTIGDTSNVELLDGASTPMFAALLPLGQAALLTPIAGKNAGVQNNPQEPEKERERLLTHLIFSPVLKAASRTLTVTYTLTITVARTAQTL